MNERGRYDKRNQKGQGGSDPVCTLFHIYCLYGSGSSLFKMAKLGSCGDNLWAFGEYRTSDADRTVQQTGEVILLCYDMDEYYFTIGSIITGKIHDSTLQGDIFHNESVFTTDIYPLVWDNKAGFYARWNNFAFYYDLIMESTDKRNLDWTDNSFRYHTLKFIFFR